MTIYEQIQNALEYIEKHMFNKISHKDVAKVSCMSTRSFYNYFWCLTGMTFKEYVIKRRLTESVNKLIYTSEKIINIALEVGYETHESYTRAFKKEFGVTPIQMRNAKYSLTGFKKLTIIKEMYMGIIIREVEEMRVAFAVGTSPDAETKAHDKIIHWQKSLGIHDKPFRNFGYDTDSEGNRDSNTPFEEHGYKVLVTIPDNIKDNNVVSIGKIKKGKFLVTGVEGNFDDDPEGNWIGNGWKNMYEMIQKKGYKLKTNGRCYEEKLEPSKSENLRLDLYLEIE
jgi:AraC-like DNA-binding protein